MRNDGVAIEKNLKQSVIDLTLAYSRLISREDLRGKDRERVRKALEEVDDALGMLFILFHSR